MAGTSALRKVGGPRLAAGGRAVALAVVLGLGSIGAAVALSGAPAGASTAKPGATTPSTPTGAPTNTTPLSPNVRPSLAGPGPSNVFVTNEGTDTATGYATSASGNSAPSYGVGGTATSPFHAEAEVLDTSGDLWVANSQNDTIVEYLKSSLAQSGNPVPAIVLTSDSSNSIDGPSGLAFDSSGDLWVTNVGNNSVVEFTPSQLAASGNPTPNVTLTSNGSDSIDGPYGLVFDSSGDLWVANYNAAANSMVEFTSTQLAASGSPTPNVTLTMPANCGPNGAVFDASGNLWVPCYTTNQVVEIAKSSLGTTGTPAPAVTISATAGSLDEPEYAAFDSSGDLWVVNAGNSTVVEYKADHITSSGSPAPDVTLSAAGSGTPNASLDVPYDLAFDSSGNLWVVNEGSLTISAFSPSQYAASGSPTPAIQITPAYGLDSPQLEAFDSSGNLWIANPGSSSVVAFTPAQLASGAARPAIALTLPLGAYPEGLAFDSSGDLWVSDAANNSLYEFTPSELSSSGTPTPKVTITSDASHSLDGPAGLAFDGSGDLWVANEGNNTLVEYTPSQLAASGSPTPTATISANGSHSLDVPVGVAFDSSGDLWVSNAANSSLVEYTATQLGDGTGGPTPNVTLTSDASASLDSPMGLAFDGSGNLWVANQANDSLVEFTSSQLSATGSPTPTDTVAGSATLLDDPVGVAIPPSSERAAQTGYWEVAADGGIFSFGVPFHGSMG